MDFDISHMSSKARKRLISYINSTNPMRLLIMLPLPLCIIAPGIGAYIASLFYPKNETAIGVGAVIGTIILLGSGCLLMIKIYSKSAREHLNKFIQNGNMPKCFECNIKIQDRNISKCPQCGADLKIIPLKDSSSHGLLSYKNYKPNNFSISPSLNLLLLNITFLLICGITSIYWLYVFQNTRLASAEKTNSMLSAILDYSNGRFKYIIPKVGHGYSTVPSGKQLNGVPVYYNLYENSEHDYFTSLFFISSKNDAIDHAISYNKQMSRMLNNKFNCWKKSDGSMTEFTSPYDTTRGKIIIIPKFYFGDEVKYKGQNAIITGITTDSKGIISYSLQIKKHNVLNVPAKLLSLLKNSRK